MRTTRTYGLVAAIAMAVSTYAQNWVGAGNGFTTTQYLGINANGTIPLRLTTVPNFPIELRTNDVLRARFNGTAAYTIGSFAAQAKNGALGLSLNNTLWSNGPGPFSRLHLHDGTTNVLQASYRPWMSTGITLTGNRDHQFIGQKGKQSDYTDLVIHWSDNPGEWLKDRLRFIFTSGYDAGVS